MKKVLLLVGVVIGFIGTRCLGVEEKPQKDSLYREISNLNMRIFGHYNWGWDVHTQVEYIKHLMKDIRSPIPAHKRHNAFEFFEKYEELHPTTVTIKEDSSLWQDLDLYCGKNRSTKYVANALDRTTTELGKLSLYELLSHPIKDVTLLKKRQEIILFFVQHPEVVRDCQKALSAIASSENYLLSFWGHGFQHSIENNLFNHSFVKFLNKSETALFIKSYYDHANRSWFLGIKTWAAAILILYGTMLATHMCDVPESLTKMADKYSGYGGLVFTVSWSLKNRYIHAALAILAGLWCAGSLKQQYDWTYGGILLDQCVQEIIHHMSIVMYGMTVLYAYTKKYPILGTMGDLQPIVNFFDQKTKMSEDVNELITLLDKPTHQDPKDFFVNRGFILRAYTLIDSLKDTCQEAFVAMARFDTYLSFSKLIQEFKTKNVHFSFPNYITNSECPCLKITDFWHPLVNIENIVPNSLTLGTENNRSNIILTGPNEGGKSTVLKTVALCVLMAQTCGVVPAQAMVYTPFANLSTYLNITDDIGAGNSLFKSEVLRAQQLIDYITNAKKGEFNLSVFDEVFNGTSPIEGCAAAYSVAKHLSQFPQSICLIATHFPLLTQLESETTTFQNYKVSVIKNPDGTISYPYNLEKGASTQHIALDILKNQGFASSVINEAQKIVQQLS